VDILRDGASAVYGSDAVAGVINFVADTDFDGDEIQVQKGVTEIGSGSDTGLTWTHGNFAFGEKLHWISTFDFFQRDAPAGSAGPHGVLGAGARARPEHQRADESRR
jgi:outer membrane receptor protein involved in Fe transport